MESKKKKRTRRKSKASAPKRLGKKKIYSGGSARHGLIEAKWKPLPCFRYATKPDQFWCWLADSHSLTKRIINHCHESFRVEVLSQALRKPLPSEARLLGMPLGRRALIRQVYLYCGEQPLVFARTVIPISSLTGRERRLARLKSRSLGATLFSDPSMHRGDMEAAQLSVDNKLFALATDRLTTKPREIWGRRSVYFLHNKPLLVGEYFLPGATKIRS